MQPAVGCRLGRTAFLHVYGTVFFFFKFSGQLGPCSGLANVEKVFSRAGLLADPNLLPAHLSTLVMVGFNKKAFKPQFNAIKDKYYEMFRNKSGKETRV